jgi:CRISPR-associated protein Csm1
MRRYFWYSKFIYDISSKYASKSLKGRSFSLQLMLDEIASEVIRITKTTLSHIIYSSGENSLWYFQIQLK